MNEAEQKAVELLKSVLLQFQSKYFISPKPFLEYLIEYYNSAAHKRETEGFNYRVCLKVFDELYGK